jgi:hypothetical protein
MSTTSATVWDAATLAENLVPVITIWREASNQPVQGMLAVAFVIRERMKRRKLTADEVCLEHMQFSSMNVAGRWPRQNDADQQSFRDSYTAWIESGEGATLDPSEGADFYFNPKLVFPAWAHDFRKTVTIAEHDFYDSGLKPLPVSQAQEPGAAPASQAATTAHLNVGSGTGAASGAFSRAVPKISS